MGVAGQVRQALERIASLVTRGAADAEALDWSALRYQHTAALRAQLAAEYQPATVNKMLAALKGTLKQAWRLGFIDAGDYQRAVDLPTLRSTVLPRGRGLARGELVALFNACSEDGSPAGARDAAILALLYGSGLRRGELVTLDLEDYNADTGAVTVRHGKGSKARICYATNGSRSALEAWLRHRGAGGGALFFPVDKMQRVIRRRMTDQAVLYILRKRAVEAGVEAFSPHDLRRSFISDLLDAGADIATVQRLAGHASVQTTARYDRRGERTKKRAAELLHVPYRGESSRDVAYENCPSHK